MWKHSSDKEALEKIQKESLLYHDKSSQSHLKNRSTI